MMSRDFVGFAFIVIGISGTIGGCRTAFGALIGVGLYLLISSSL